MRQPIKIRTLTTEKVTKINCLAASRKELNQQVQRAGVIAYMKEDPSLYATKASMKAGSNSSAMGPEWIPRFNEKGLKGLEDQPRPGRQSTPQTRSTQRLDRTGRPETEHPGIPLQAVDPGAAAARL